MSNTEITKRPGARVGSTAFTGAFAMTADTHPDAEGPMAAPTGCADALAYRNAIRRRFKTDRAARQQMLCLARSLAGSQHRGKVPITGPFAGEALEVLTSFHRSQTQARGRRR